MVFTSFLFLVFVAVTVLVYYLVPGRFQWIVLLAASYFFFWTNSQYLALLLLLTTAVSFFTARAVFAVKTAGARQAEGLSGEEKTALKAKTKNRAKRILLLGVAVDLGILLFVKYFNFFAGNANSVLKLLGVQIPYLHLLIPLGISFYTLQALAYMIDVYRGKLEPDKNFGQFMLFMSFFPQIVQGPIARHAQLAHQLYEPHRFDYTRLTYGAQLMLWGLFKKLVIADRIADPVGKVFDPGSGLSGPAVLVGIALYGVQVYMDFSGGMDIARGVSQMLGVELELNFRQPFFARSLEEFWRRWHMTLGGWMRDYVFYPLSLSKPFAKLSRKARNVFGVSFGKKLPTFLAMFIVYMLVGFWHGAEWKYVVYGVWNSVIISSGILLGGAYQKGLQKCRIRSESAPWRLFQMLRTFAICSVGRTFSASRNVPHAFSMLRSGFTGLLSVSNYARIMPDLGLGFRNLLLICACLLAVFISSVLHERGVQIRQTVARQKLPVRWLIYLVGLFAVLLFGVWGPGYDSVSFIYERF